jgi:hypothetical protein
VLDESTGDDQDNIECKKAKQDDADMKDKDKGVENV